MRAMAGDLNQHTTGDETDDETGDETGDETDDYVVGYSAPLLHPCKPASVAEHHFTHTCSSRVACGVGDPWLVRVHLGGRSHED